MMMNGHVRDGYPPGAGSSHDPDQALWATIVAAVTQVRELDAAIAAAEAEVQHLPTLLAWMVQVRHPALWLLCASRDQVQQALCLPAADARRPPPRRSFARALALLALLASLALLALLAWMAWEANLPVLVGEAG